MFVTPHPITGQQAAALRGEDFACPGCIVQRTEDPIDTGWVRCPLVKEHWLCLGCCIDWGWDARRWCHMTEDVDKSIIVEAADQLHLGVPEMLRTCLTHQLELIDADYDSSHDIGLRDAIADALAALEQQLRGS